MRDSRLNPRWHQHGSGLGLDGERAIFTSIEKPAASFHWKALSFPGRLTRVQCMKLYQQDLEKIADLTLEHYNRRAEEFWEGTRDHDVSQNIAALLRFIESEPPFMILDFGCGPGRDLKAFAERGHIAVGLEGAPHTAAMARAHSGCEVWQQDFLKLDLPRGRFDGVFANAALFHVPSQELPRVLRELHASLKPGGVLFSSNPHGHNEEGWNRGRYGVYHDLETWRRFVSAAGFVELTHYYRPAGVPREQQHWLASVWRS
jgi:SAM-dependent methyltransferase